jgi:hypothetical protein
MTVRDVLIKELEEIELRKTLLEAELAGLDQRRRALEDAATRLDESSTADEPASGSPKPETLSTDVTKLGLGDGVVYVITDSEAPVRIDDVGRALEEAATRLDQSTTDQPASPSTKPEAVSADVAKLSRLDAVVQVINESEAPMRVHDVCQQLNKLGRHDRPTSIPVTLNYAARIGRIRHVARGLYRRQSD